MECNYCNQEIKENEEIKHFAKMIFHRKCFKKWKKCLKRLIETWLKRGLEKAPVRRMRLYYIG